MITPATSGSASAWSAVATAAPTSRPEPRRPLGDRIDDVFQRQAGLGGGVARMDLADAAGAEEGERGHQMSSTATGAPVLTERPAASARARARTLAS